jgi:hypothetical protein
MKSKFCFFIAIALVCQAGAVRAADSENPIMVYPVKYKCFDLLQFESLQQTAEGNFVIRSDQTPLLTEYFQVAGWLRGFFSARNLFFRPADGDTTKNTTEKEWMPWIYSYCRAHPTAGLAEAAEQLSQRLGERR